MAASEALRRTLLEGLVILALFPISIASAHKAEKTLGHDASPIVTVWGVGYKVSVEPKVAQAS